MMQNRKATHIEHQNMKEKILRVEHNAAEKQRIPEGAREDNSIHCPRKRGNTDSTNNICTEKTAMFRLTREGPSTAWSGHGAQEAAQGSSSDRLHLTRIMKQRCEPRTDQLLQSPNGCKNHGKKEEHAHRGAHTHTHRHRRRDTHTHTNTHTRAVSAANNSERAN